MTEERSACSHCCASNLWRRKFWIIGLAALAAILGGLIEMRKDSSPSYVASAQLLIEGRLPVEDVVGILEQDQGRGATALTPVTYRILLLNDSLLGKLQSRTGTPIGRLRDDLEVEIVLESDTAYRRVYSPVITIRVHGETEEKSAALLSEWLKVFFEDYGHLRPDDGDTARRSVTIKGYDLRLLSKTVLKEDKARHPMKTAAASGAAAVVLLCLLFLVEGCSKPQGQDARAT